jgi:hypothetical protein
MCEWLKQIVLKTIRPQGLASSNLALSANKKTPVNTGVFSCLRRQVAKQLGLSEKDERDSKDGDARSGAESAIAGVESGSRVLSPRSVYSHEQT